MAKRIALLLGINRCAKSPEIPELQGAVNDVNDMANMLYRFGFDTNNVEIITDQRASRDRIVAGLKDLKTRRVKAIMFCFILLDMGHIQSSPLYMGHRILPKYCALTIWIMIIKTGYL